jgi:drug/metabolite transporter (DMT)-like permease
MWRADRIMPKMLRQLAVAEPTTRRLLRGATPLMIGAGLAYGVALPAGKAALHHVAPLQVLLWTRLIAIAALSLIACLSVTRRRSSVHAQVPTFVRYTLGLGVLLFSSYALLLAGLAATRASLAAMVLALHIVITPVVARLALHDAPRACMLAAACACLVGVTVTVAPSGEPGWSALLIAGAALLTALHTVVLARAASRHHPIELVLGQNVVTGMLAFAVLRGRIDPAGAGQAAFALLAGGILPSLVAATAQARAQRTLSATLTAVILALEPLCAARSLASR